VKIFFFKPSTPALLVKNRNMITSPNIQMRQRIQPFYSRKSIDSIDCRIIELLQKDGRVSNIEIAKSIGISEATVSTRLQRLIQEKYIQIVAVSNPRKLGFKVVGTIHGGGPQNLDSVLSSDSDPNGRIRDEQET